MSGVEVIGTITGIISALQTAATFYENRNDISLSEAFESAGRRLPVLLHILQAYEASLEPLKDSLPSEVCQALGKILDACNNKAQTLSEIFSKVMSGPTDPSSWRQRYSKVVRKLGERNKVETLMTAITEDVQLLVNSEFIGPTTPSQNRELESILDELKDLRDSTLQEGSVAQSFCSRGSQSNNFNSGSACTMPNEDFGFHGPLGICLDQAPPISPGLVAREAEKNSIREALHPINKGMMRIHQQQRRLALGGIGGIGKTQITLSYSQTPSMAYETVLWLDATSELSLRNSFATAAGLIFGSRVSRSLEGDECVRRTREWLSHPKNSRWLLVFDNYDNPRNFKLDPYYPPAAHGAIIITTRCPDLVTGITEVLRIKPLENIKDSLMILQARSKRENALSDPWAKQLAERLAGLPLALATAGVYLQQSPFSFQRYLQEYEERWNIDPHRPVKLQEYQERTLYTAWKISYDRLVEDDPEAATMLRMMAYFDNGSLWYELFRAGLKDQCPLYDVIKDEVSFNGVMRALSEYSFTEFHPHLKEWSMHNCIHDWISDQLCRVIDSEMYWYAVDCVSGSVRNNTSESLVYSNFARYVPHAKRLTQRRFLRDDTILGSAPERLVAASDVSCLLISQMQYDSARNLLEPLLSASQTGRGRDDAGILKIMNDLGHVYLRQRKPSEAKSFFERTLAGIVKANVLSGAIGKDVIVEEYVPVILEILGLLKNTCCGNDKQGSTRVIRRWAVEFDGNKIVTQPTLVKDLLHLIDSLGLVLINKDKQDEAVQILKQLIWVRERIQGPTCSNATTMENVGWSYMKQGKLDDAEEFYTRAVSENRKVFGPNHRLTLSALADLARVYCKQSRFEESESALTRVLIGREKIFGTMQEQTLEPVLELARLYRKHQKILCAENMYTRALSLQEMLLGPNDPRTIDTVARLGSLYLEMERWADAGKMYLRVLGYPSTPQALRVKTIEEFCMTVNISTIYLKTDRSDEAEQLLLHLLDVTEKATDISQAPVRACISFNLATVWLQKGQVHDAEKLLMGAKEAISKLSGSGHPLVPKLSDYLRKIVAQQGLS
ncbi:hypothetical protein BDV59DRAFT_207825 [Aspergillus ambiguus]|uniref:uncharacterized protein n=1 Tax=Aspergillus ambiguus TaxID=176160 RepID=UPI003CCDAD9C